MNVKVPDLSIVIVSYNTRKITHQCLESIYASFQSYKSRGAPSFEIILIDNASTKDDSAVYFAHYAKKHKNMIFVANTSNTGYGPANNQGVKLAKGTYILLLNSDTVILKDALHKLLSYYQKNENTKHFIGPKLLNKDMTSQPSAAPFYTLPVVFGALFLRGDYWGLTRLSPKEIQKVDWVSGAAIMTKREYFVKVGGFDETIFMYMEEVDLLYRAKKIGMNTFFYPKVKLIHLGSASSNGKTFPIIQVYRGFLFLYKKHYGKYALFFLRFLLRLKAGFAWFLGFIINNNYLKKTYEEAFRVAGQ
ncbi:MAG: glycosyltransferase family 2 protein [bacterium]